jgi:hypothetical protein
VLILITGLKNSFYMYTYAQRATVAQPGLVCPTSRSLLQGENKRSGQARPQTVRGQGRVALLGRRRGLKGGRKMSKLAHLGLTGTASLAEDLDSTLTPHALPLAGDPPCETLETRHI